jgi:hypothetical protein
MISSQARELENSHVVRYFYRWLVRLREARKSINDGAQDSEVIIYLSISFTWFSVRTRETERIANLQLDGDCLLIHIQ